MMRQPECRIPADFFTSCSFTQAGDFPSDGSRVDVVLHEVLELISLIGKRNELVADVSR